MLNAAVGPDIRHLGRVPYADAFALQNDLREARASGRVGDTVLLLEHPDVITFGRSAKSENALHSDDEYRALGFDVHYVNRGGDVTYHGPGQLVGYPILDLSHHGSDLHVYLRRLEAVLIAVCGALGVAAARREGYAGVWLDDRRKIASIGVGVRRWLTMHGFALNVSCDLGRFAEIVPCGLTGVEMVSLESVLGRPVDFDAVAAVTEAELRAAFA